jgi:hypothetical protein
MKYRIDYVLLFVGVVLSSLLYFIFQPQLMVYEREGEYFDSGTDEVVRDINPEYLSPAGSLSIEGGPLAGSYILYNYVPPSKNYPYLLFVFTILSFLGIQLYIRIKGTLRVYF